MIRSFLLALLLATSWQAEAGKPLRLLIFADLHYDMMPDGDKRLDTILDAAIREKVDLIVNLGDLAAPTLRFGQLQKKLSGCPVPICHVLGNHDLDEAGKDDFLRFYSMPAPYYHVDKGRFRLIFMDSNFFLDKEGKETGYDRANYRTSNQRELFSQEQHLWLKKMLSTRKICLIFSHGPINDGYTQAIQNKNIHRIIAEAQNHGTRIAAIFGGHIHSDNYHVIDNIHYMQINSASNIWGGSSFINTQRYPREIYRQYKALQYIIPYEDALYAIVKADDKGKVEIKGIRSNYLKPAPDSEKLRTKPYPCSPDIQDRTFFYRK